MKRYLYEGLIVEIVMNRFNGTVDVEIVGSETYDPDLPFPPGRQRLQRVDMCDLTPYEHFELETHCKTCNEPIFTGQGRYRISGKEYCVDCGEELRKKRERLLLWIMGIGRKKFLNGI